MLSLGPAATGLRRRVVRVSAGVVRAPAGALASRASPVTGYYPAQPLRCDIVAVLTVMM